MSFRNFSVPDYGSLDPAIAELNTRAYKHYFLESHRIVSFYPVDKEKTHTGAHILFSFVIILENLKGQFLGLFLFILFWQMSLVTQNSCVIIPDSL